MADPDIPKQYVGELDSHHAASAMQAARLNAVELLDTADILFNLKRFPHSLVFSILAIEEVGKLAILQGILLNLGGTSAELWRSYRRHRAKTESLNVGIWARIRATFPEIPEEQAHELAARGPTPDELETSKQRAIYSDCLEHRGSFACHLPKNLDWRQAAWERLCEARAIVLAPRDRSPEELDVWIKHASAARASGKNLAAVLPDLHKELAAKGFLKDGSWDPLLKDLGRQPPDV